MRQSRPTNILVADDDGVMRDLLRDLLTQAGYRVRLAMNGSDALAHCTRYGASWAPPSLALLDMNMPHGDGIETCRLLRELPGWGRVPIVMVTAQNTDGAVRNALDAGADGFVVKPFSSRDLLKRIWLWTGGQAGMNVHSHLPAAAGGWASEAQSVRAESACEPAGPGTTGVAKEAAGKAARIVPGIPWSVGHYSLPSHARGEAQDISRLLLSPPGQSRP